MPQWLIRPDGARIWFDADSSGTATDRPTLLLVPPGSRNAGLWPPRWLARLRREWRLVRCDLRDQGRSSWHSGGVSAAQLSGDVAALMRHPAIAPQAVVALGLGAFALLGRDPLSATCPERVVVGGCSPWWADPSQPGPEEAVVVATTMRLRAERPGRDDRLLRAELRALGGDGGLSGPGGDVIGTAVRLRSHGWNRADGHHGAWVAAPALPDVSPWKPRTVVVHGSADPLVPLAHGARLAELLETSLVAVEGAGHHLDERLLDALASALRS